MNLFPRPRIPFFIALALAFVTWGISLLIFYFVFKRQYDSTGLSAICGAANTSMRTRKTQTLVKVNRAAIDRVYSKFGDVDLCLKYGLGAPMIHWGVLRHPMLNDGQPFTLRVNRKGESVHVEASPGEAWWLLTDRLWLGRMGTAPGLPKSLKFSPDESIEGEESTDPEDMAMAMLIWELSRLEVEFEVPSLTIERVFEFASKHGQPDWVWEHYWENMRLWVCINTTTYFVGVRNLNVAKKEAGHVGLTVTVCAPDVAPAQPQNAEFEALD